MRLLLDTHVAIWFLTQSSLISENGRKMIADPANSVYVSAATIWEIAIKHPLQKADAPPMSASDAIVGFGLAGYIILSITAAHAAAVEKLPRLHGDPFDRLLVAQALTEPLVLLTHDTKVSRYSDTIIRV